MSLVFLISVILKGLGALLEIALQILITRSLGVSGYGNYATWISTADLLFWACFSGLAKCNTYYLTIDNSSISEFKKKYYMRYVFPVLIFIALILIGVVKKPGYSAVLLITALELMVLDQSSTLIAKGKPKVSLVGEYVLGRLVLLISVTAASVLGHLTLNVLIILYIFQYLCVLLFFSINYARAKIKFQDISEEVEIKKWGLYQRGDLTQALIGQMPVVIQFLFAGAFEAGVVSIVLMIKKLINFISGPTSKIFLPEFSRLYRENRKDEIRTCFASIMRIQMLFVGPLAVVLIGYPRVVLRILAEELLTYSHLFMLCSAVFILGATLGPCGGVMQMTGKEKQDNHYREGAVLMMLLVMFLFRRDCLFVLYALCVQTTVEAVGKYIFVCRWMKKAPVSIGIYLSWWILPVAIIAVTYILHLQNSILAMIFGAGIVFAVGLFQEFRNEKGMLQRFIR